MSVASVLKEIREHQGKQAREDCQNKKNAHRLFVWQAKKAQADRGAFLFIPRIFTEASTSPYNHEGFHIGASKLLPRKEITL